MTKSLTPNKLKNIQANMALEGHLISDEALKEVAQSYKGADRDGQVDEAMKLSEELSIPYIEALESIKAKSFSKKLNQ